MSDRWKHELKKLRGVEPSAGLWDRAQQPPSADRLPPRRERIVAGVVAVSVFAAAGAFAFQALRPTGGSTVGTVDTKTTVVADFFAIANEETPRARMTFGGTSVEGVGTSYCWTFEGGNGCTDTFEPSFLDAEYFQIPQGTRLVTTGNVSKVTARLARGTLSPFEIVKNLGVVGESIDLDFMPDRYVLELTGEWPDVSRSFYFPIEIVEPTDPVVTIELTQDDVGARAVLSFQDQSQDGIPGDASIFDAGSVGLVWDGSAIAEFMNDLAVNDFTELPSGVALKYSGDAFEEIGTFLAWPPNPEGEGSVAVDIGLDIAGADPGRYVLGVVGRWSDGEPFAFFFGIEIVSGSVTSSPIVAPVVPDIARVVCTEGGVQVLTPVVAAQSDGLHLVFENPSGAKAFDLHPVNSERGTSVGGTLESQGETTSRGFSLEPDEVQVACLPTINDSYLEQPTASLRIEDPDGLWIPLDPACTDATAESSGPIGDVYGLSDDEVESAIRQALTGILESDEVLKPGYPETDFKVINLVVRRDGVIVANVWIAGGLHLEACEGSGIAIAPAPDTAPLDCSPVDQIAFEHTGGVDEPAGEAFIRVNTVGILATDVLARTGPGSGPTGDDGIWTVGREGSVIAWVDYPDLNGVACAGSGVGGVADS